MQLAYGEISPRKVNKPVTGQYAAAGSIRAGTWPSFGSTMPLPPVITRSARS